MSKRRHTLWNQDAFEFDHHTHGQHHHVANDTMDGWDVEAETEETSEFLEEAHEALSKLFTKTSKRGNQLRGMRRNDAWH